MSIDERFPSPGTQTAGSAADLRSVAGKGEAPDDRLLLTVVEAARRIGVGRSLMYQLLSSGEVESVHIGRLHKVPAAALGAFVERLRAGARTSAP